MALEPARCSGKHWVIIGLPGSGKSTLARRWAGELKFLHIEADLYADQGTERLRERVARLLESNDSEGWIYEGLLRRTEDLVLPQADTLIWIQERVWLCFARLVRREILGSRSWRDFARGAGRIRFFLRNWKTSISYYERLCAAFAGEVRVIPAGRGFSSLVP